MTNLDNTTGKIKAFLNASILKFQSENNTPSSIGVYCCPWSGWISMHFNATKNLMKQKTTASTLNLWNLILWKYQNGKMNIQPIIQNLN